MLASAGVAAAHARRRARGARQARQDRRRRRRGGVRRARHRPGGGRRCLAFLGGVAGSEATPSDVLARLAAFVAAHEAGAACGRATSPRFFGAHVRDTPAARPHSDRPEPGARAVILHGRHHGSRRAGPGRQPGRRRAVRQPDRHVPRARRFRPAGSRSGLERILVVMAERGMFPAASCGRSGRRDGRDLERRTRRAESLALAGELRRAGLRVDVYPEPDKPGKQLKYAAARQYHVVALIGRRRAARRDGHGEEPADGTSGHDAARADGRCACRHELVADMGRTSSEGVIE